MFPSTSSSASPIFVFARLPARWSSKRRCETCCNDPAPGNDESGDVNDAASTGFRTRHLMHRSGERRGRGRNPDSGDEQLVLPADLEAAATQDLFVYSLAKLKLRKEQHNDDADSDGGRTLPGSLCLGRARNAKRCRKSGRGGGHVKSPLQISENRVWHQLVPDRTRHVCHAGRPGLR